MNRRRPNPVLVNCLLAGFAVSLLSAEEKTPSVTETPSLERPLPDLHLLHPIWNSPVVHRESVLPMQGKEGSPITGRLALPVAELLSVKSANGERTLEVGKDVRLGDDGKTLVFSPDAKLPVVTESEMFPPAGSPNSYKHRVGHPEQNLLYAEGHWFHDRQIEVTYKPKEKWAGPVPGLAEKQLPKTFARLRAKQPIILGVSGDSITQGYNASGFTKGKPHMPPYPDLVASQLEASYGAKVTLKNRAISGWGIVNGLQDLDKLLAEKPQLIIVAYGMNDVGRRDPAWFKGQVATLIERIQKSDAEIEIILVASMLGNAEWIHTPREMFAKYRDVLAELIGPGVALADLTAIWETLLKSKHDLDLIGNGLNHPNDFGHRLYAQAILSLLVAPGDGSQISAIKHAIERGVAIVERGAKSYPTHRKCFACHHQTLPLLAINEAKRAGLAVDEKLPAELVEFTTKSFGGKLDDLKAGENIGGKGLTVGYGLWTLKLADYKPDDLTAAMVTYLRKTQEADGQWKLHSIRPPMEESLVTSTVLAAYGLLAFTPETEKADSAAAVEKAQKWLANAKLTSLEDFVVRLWGLQLLGGKADEIESARKAVLALQREDGGWAQLPEMTPDAYATGLALAVLHESGLPKEDDACRRAVEYLLKSQEPDGSWHVKTRAKPVQVFFDNGDPHGKDQFISISATGWATAALARVISR